MPPRNARGRGRGRGPRAARGRGAVPVEEEVQAPLAQEQGEAAEAPHSAGEAQSGAPAVAQPAALDAGAILQQLAATIAALAGGAARPDQPPPAPAEYTTLERFRRMRPPTYDGVADTDVAERFLVECEKIFEAMGVVDPASRRTLITFQLEGKAYTWWTSIKGAEGTARLTWEAFKERFRDQFFPQSLRDAKREEFVHLVQGSLSVLEYERRFMELAQYAPELISTEHHKCRKFERGLRPALRGKMVLLGMSDYQLLVNRAITVERDMEETRGAFEGRRGRNSGAQQEGGSRKRLKGGSSTPQFQQGPQPSQASSAPRQTRRPEASISQPLFCYKCKQSGHRRSECPQNTRQAESVSQTRGGPAGDARVCYGCGQPGHIRRFCPFAPGGALESEVARQLVTR